MTKHCLFFVFAIALLPLYLSAQELHILTTSDFDLVGKVKKCIVITNYGKEEFNFNEAGVLTKSVTRYTDEDYSITYYKYKNKDILEKRVENYRDGAFVKNTSIAHLYENDSVLVKKITENIITYSKKFLDQYQYTYDTINRLVAIKRINDKGVDETIITYIEKEKLKEQSYFLNGELYKVIRKQKIIGKDKKETKSVLTKEFSNGKPLKAVEVVFTNLDVMLSKNYFIANEKETGFVFDKKETFVYKKDKPVLDKILVKTNETEKEISYMHQFDGDKGNWIKQVISPSNTYITRKVEYYPSEEKTTEENTN